MTKKRGGCELAHRKLRNFVKDSKSRVLDVIEETDQGTGLGKTDLKRKMKQLHYSNTFIPILLCVMSYKLFSIKKFLLGKKEGKIYEIIGPRMVAYFADEL